jgi:hypothetical protein
VAAKPLYGKQKLVLLLEVPRSQRDLSCTRRCLLYKQGPEWQLDLSTLQRTLPHQDMFSPQGRELHLGLSGSRNLY